MLTIVALVSRKRRTKKSKLGKTDAAARRTFVIKRLWVLYGLARVQGGLIVANKCVRLEDINNLCTN